MDNPVNECLSESMLRYYLDQGNLLPATEYRQLTAHLDGCRLCQYKLQALEWQVQRVNQLMAEVMPVATLPEPDPKAALARFRTRQHQVEEALVGAITKEDLPGRSPSKDKRGQRGRKRFGWPFSFSPKSPGRWPRRAWLASLVLLVALLVVPPISTAAEQFLQVFRVHDTVFVPVDQQRLQQLLSLGLQNIHAWFLDGPTFSTGTATRDYDSVEAAAPVVEFVAKVPQSFPRPVTGRQVVVRSGLSVQFTLNVPGLRQTLKLLNINDITISDQLGSQPISAEMPPFVEQRYQGQNYNLILDQSLSPQVNLPDKVDITLLSQLALRVLGMNSQEAALLSQQIDLRSALIFPFPGQLNSFKQVQLGANKGLLVNSGSKEKPGWVLYWQEGDRFFVLIGQGVLTESDMLTVAGSLG